jgi:hypothetical protein
MPKKRHTPEEIGKRLGKPPCRDWGASDSVRFG